MGSNPVPVAVTRDGRYVLVGITNRFGSGGTTAGRVVVIDNHTTRIVGSIPVGKFPREFSYGREPTLFLMKSGPIASPFSTNIYFLSLITNPNSVQKPAKEPR